jgi:hypothetical protein
VAFLQDVRFVRAAIHEHPRLDVSSVARQIFIVPQARIFNVLHWLVTGRKMKPGYVDQSSILDRILDTAADNLRVAKILIQLGLDSDNVTYHAIFNRVLEILLAQITLANMCALLGSLFFVATLLMRTMMPLRISEHDQQPVLYGLWRARRRYKDPSFVSTDAAH